MSLPFDATLKTLIESFPEDWLRLLGLTADGPVSILNADTATTSSQADKVILVKGVRPWILHIEVQVSRDRNLPSRLLRYNVLLSERHGVPVLTLVVLLRPDADGPELTGQVVRDLPVQGQYLTFGYQAVRVWQESPDTFLSGGPGLLPLAPLANVNKSRLPPMIRQMEQRLGGEPDRAKAADLWVATYVLLGLRYPEAFAAELLKGVRDLEESVTYQAIIRKGREQGFADGEARGKAEGKAEGVREALLRVGRKRLGEPDTTTQATIAALSDVEQIETLIERVLEVENWRELFAP